MRCRSLLCTVVLVDLVLIFWLFQRHYTYIWTHYYQQDWQNSTNIDQLLTILILGCRCTKEHHHTSFFHAAVRAYNHKVLVIRTQFVTNLLLQKATKIFWLMFSRNMSSLIIQVLSNQVLVFLVFSLLFVTAANHCFNLNSLSKV